MTAYQSQKAGNFAKWAYQTRQPVKLEHGRTPAAEAVGRIGEG
jgi:hypothetical protein